MLTGIKKNFEESDNFFGEVTSNECANLRQKVLCDLPVLAVHNLDLLTILL